jgi:hypothetical protein
MSEPSVSPKLCVPALPQWTFLPSTAIATGVVPANGERSRGAAAHGGLHHDAVGVVGWDEP